MTHNGIFGNTIHHKVSINTLVPYMVMEETITSFDLRNKEVFTAIYNKLYPYAFFFAHQIVTKEDASDIVASVFGKLWSQKKQFENLPHIKAFLRVAVRNTCISHLRTQSSRMRKEEIGYHKLFDGETDDIFLREEISAETLSRIYTEIEKLPFRCKEIFKMAYLQNLKNSEIARRLGITLRTVQNQKCSALKMLRMTLLAINLFLLHTGIPLVHFQ